MKQLFYFLALLALMWPAATEAQYEYEAHDFYQTQSKFDSWVKECAKYQSDTLTIEEAILLRKTLIGKSEFTQYGDFVITRTKYSTGGFNQGLYWPDGTIVPLPINFMSDHSSLEERGKDLFLSYVTKDRNGGYSIYYLLLPSLEVKGVLPRQVMIKPLLY